MKEPIVELSDCITCEICAEVCPSVFYLNDVGYIEITPCTIYPETEVDEAIKHCPKNCISWIEGDAT